MSTDSFSEISNQSWFGRLGESIKGVLVGLLLFVVSFPLLWWNEGRSVKTANGLAELGKSVVSISVDKVDPASDKKPVHLTGRATTDEVLRDSVFPVSTNAIKLLRQVEIYEWEEEKKSESKKKLGGGTETVTTYEYKKGWHSEIIDSQEFKHPEGHANPEKMRFPEEEKTAQLVKIGAFRLSTELIAQMDQSEPLPFTSDDLKKLPPELKAQVALEDNTLYFGQNSVKPADPKNPQAGQNAEKEVNKPAESKDPQTGQDVSPEAAKPADPKNPQVGDLRISFAAVKPAVVSIIARQLGDTFESWTSSNGQKFERLMPGEISAENMVGEMEAENARLTWILRLVGFLLMAFGIGLVMNPLSVFADVIPFLGSLLGAGIALFAGVIALGLSLTTIALAWIAYRPLLGIGLLVVAVALVVGVKMLLSKKKATG